MTSTKLSRSPSRMRKGKKGRPVSYTPLFKAAKRILKAGLGALTLVAIVALGRMAYNSSYCKVSQVVVLGTEQLSSDQVVDATGLLGSHILDLDRDQVVQSLKRWPLVKNASVKWKPPNEIVITIQERQAAALWQVADTKYIVDDEGFVLGEAPSSGPVPEFCIIHSDGQPLQAGHRVDAEAIQLASRLTETLPQTLGMKAQRFEFLTRGGLVVVTDKGWRARFGDMDDFDFKLAVWKELLAEAAQLQMKPQHVDLRFGTRPFYRQ